MLTLSFYSQVAIVQSTSGSKAKEDLAAAMGAIQVVLFSFLSVVIFFIIVTNLAGFVLSFGSLL